MTEVVFNASAVQMKLSNVCFSSSGSLLKHSPINASLQRLVGRKEGELKIPAEHLNPELLTVLSADNPDVKCVYRAT